MRSGDTCRAPAVDAQGGRRPIWSGATSQRPVPTGSGSPTSRRCRRARASAGEPPERQEQAGDKGGRDRARCFGVPWTRWAGHGDHRLQRSPGGPVGCRLLRPYSTAGQDRRHARGSGWHRDPGDGWAPEARYAAASRLTSAARRTGQIGRPGPRRSRAVREKADTAASRRRPGSNPRSLRGFGVHATSCPARDLTRLWGRGSGGGIRTVRCPRYLVHAPRREGPRRYAPAHPTPAGSVLRAGYSSANRRPSSHPAHSESRPRAPPLCRNRPVPFR